jgi:hypothetical protein
MHILEDHVWEWIETWGFGMALHGEQGGVQVHATMNLLKRRFWRIKTDQRRNYAMLKEHHLQISPDIQSCVPAVKKRKSLCD